MDTENLTQQELKELVKRQERELKRQERELKKLSGGGLGFSVIANKNAEIPQDCRDRDELKDGYQLKFIGKDYAKFQAGLKTETVIVPDKEHNEKPENKNSKNVFITGDNLDALKHLENAYTGKIDVIYIDPPYNTGSDGFAYRDNFNFTDAYLKEKLTLTDIEVARIRLLDGKCSHSAWLTFMLPRLIIAKRLLKDTGVIFISIDDNEQADLKLLCREIFGEGNFVNALSVKRGTKSLNSQFEKIKTLNIGFEYILVYQKTQDFYYPNPFKSASDKQQEGSWAGLYNSPDRPTMRYQIGKKTISHGQWKWSKERGLRAYQNYLNFLSNGGGGRNTERLLDKK